MFHRTIVDQEFQIIKWKNKERILNKGKIANNSTTTFFVGDKNFDIHGLAQNNIHNVIVTNNTQEFYHFSN